MLVVHSLLMWEDPKHSGMVFGGITILCGILFFSGLPIISLIAYTLSLALIVSTVWSRFGKSIGKYVSLSSTVACRMIDVMTVTLGIRECFLS